MARKLRYQALCRACIHHNVQDLLLAHHGDDQAETILMRLVSGTGTRGLAGIQAISPIPECSEIWGAERVKLLRPLLEETKVRVQKAMLPLQWARENSLTGVLLLQARLIATCNSNGVKWFEDSTNSDPKHTIRNTIRYLQSFQDPPVLPRALSKNSLLAMSSRVKAQMDHDTTILHQVMEMCQIEVCTFSGLLRFTFPREKISSLQECSGSILTQLMIHITSLISPVTQVEPKVLKKAMENLFQLNEDSQSSFTAAGLLWRLHKGKEYSVTWLIHRQPYHTKPTLPRLISGHVLVLEPSSPPRLWDNRFWFRLHSQTSSRPYTILIRPVRRSEFGNVKARLSAQNLNIPIDRAFKGIPDKARYTVPVAVRMDCKQNGLSFEGEQFHESIEEGTVIGFPTLGVWEPGYERDVQVIMRRLEHLYEWELKEELKKGGRNYLDVGLGIRYMSPSLER